MTLAVEGVYDEGRVATPVSVGAGGREGRSSGVEGLERELAELTRHWVRGGFLHPALVEEFDRVFLAAGSEPREGPRALIALAWIRMLLLMEWEVLYDTPSAAAGQALDQVGELLDRLG